ncbi:hypothetical protein AN401_07050 [Zobellella denitrificans]|uniref:Uncharacterized protein n=1 Tax=Zobellella denitrificans TaxID=347534 RepID=A0A291HNE8_9GAMM|nr:DUF2786 domain-containing protein [Zobellella denitrificans]ATG73642.1 hypothetical protein AN401_07050 [Zobellella denitrificans]
MNKRIMEKLKKLLALAKSSNPHEAANAMAKAQKLMAEHRIDADTLALSDIDECLVRMATDSAKPPQWSVWLISSIRSAFGVEARVYQGLMDFHMMVRFYGPADRVEIAGYCHDVLRRQLARARKEYVAGLGKRMKPTNKTARADKFCEAWLAAVDSKLQKLVPTEREKELVALYEQRKFKPAGTISGREARNVRGGGHDATTAGYMAGKQATLNPGMGGQETKKIGGGL